MTTSLANLIAWLLALAVIAASVRMLWQLRRGNPGQRPRVWRVVALLSAQAASAALLYCALFPPAIDGEAGTLVVATARADATRIDGLPVGDHLVALPEAPALHDAERMPDLATALRRYPATARIRVIGAGLTARDQDAVKNRALDFVPAPLPRGLIGLWPPRHVQAGRMFTVGGHAHDLEGGSVELLDPGNRVVDRSAIGANGDFKLADTPRSAGPATWQLRLRSRDKSVVEQTTLPLDVQPGSALRVLMLAGAPTPELKYLRRWATDAGLRIDSRISLGGGMQIGDASAAFDPASLARFDLLVLDQRAWQALGDARRAQLDTAVHDGLGLLLRLPDRLAGNDAAQLRRLGFTATSANAPRDVHLPAGFAGRDADGGSDASPSESLPALTRGAQRITAIDGRVALHDADGVALASWRAPGAGRIGIITLDDSFRLVLGGHQQAHGELWGSLFSNLARARGTPAASIEDDPRIDQRTVLCGLHDGAKIDATGQRAVALRIDPASGIRACAGFWPRVSGWHVLRDDSQRSVFHVRAADDARGLQATAIREATQRLAGGSSPARRAVSSMPGPRWPWFLGWMLLTAALWWLERSRSGTADS
ncbi:MAG: carboxypeptidase regulatory-like domain-containing protein [Luteimonas sp.]